MKLPAQAPAVVRGRVSWPARRPAADSARFAIAAAGTVIKCSGNTPNPCMCENGLATCCSQTTCSVNQTTGECECGTGVP